MEELPCCPLCHTQAAVFKVSQIYVAGITRAENRSPADRALLASIYGKEELSAAMVQQVSQQFGPPSGRRQVVRPVHPDLVVFLFSAVVVVFLLNTFLLARWVFWVILLLWLASLAGYWFTRGPVLCRFQGMETSVLGEQKSVERSIGAWMKLYYCLDDNCVFMPERMDSAPLSQLQRYIQMPAAPAEA
jgi:hypothetical protein